MTGAIEFLKHVNSLCMNNHCDENCPLAEFEVAELDENTKVIVCKVERINIGMTDEEIADLVREVERWWRDND